MEIALNQKKVIFFILTWIALKKDTPQENLNMHPKNEAIQVTPRIGGYLMPFKIKTGSNKKLRADGKATQSKGIITNYLTH